MTPLRNVFIVLSYVGGLLERDLILLHQEHNRDMTRWMHPSRPKSTCIRTDI